MENNKNIKSSRNNRGVNLSLEDRFRLLYLNGRVNKTHHQKTEIKTFWECLKCGCTITVRYGSIGRKAIFCREHKAGMLNPTIVQAQYMKRLKDEQLAVIKESDKNYTKFMLDI